MRMEIQVNVKCTGCIRHLDEWSGCLEEVQRIRLFDYWTIGLFVIEDAVPIGLVEAFCLRFQTLVLHYYPIGN